MSEISRTLVLLAPLVLLAACGGGSGGDSRPAAVAPAADSEGGSLDAGAGTVMLSGCEVEAYQAELWQRVNQARSQARSCGNEQFGAVAPVTYSCTLEGAAERHSGDMADNNFFSHTGSDGLRVSHRVSATGYDWSIVGENIAAGFDEVAGVVNGWLESPGHCRNLMDPRFTEMAVSRILTNAADYDNYWTQVFAAPR